MTNRLALTALCFGLMAAPSLAHAQAATGALTFQLNNLVQAENTCGLTVLVQNDTGTVISRSIFSMAVVDTEGRIEVLGGFQFPPLRLGAPVVRTFTVERTCASLVGMFINDYQECKAAPTDTTNSAICETAIRPSSRVTQFIFPWRFAP